MKKLAEPALVVMQVFTWIAFVGFCIETGATAFTVLMSVTFNASAASDLYLGFSLSTLLEHSLWLYVAATSFKLAVLVLKVALLWQVIRLFKAFKLEQPFSLAVSEMIVKISHIALSAGILALVADGYYQWLHHRDLADRLQWGSGEFLMLAGILFIVAQVFKKGVELQQDNELTV
jgi:hypothetical protein